MKLHGKTVLFALAWSLAATLCVPAVAQQSADIVSSEQTGSAPAPQKTNAAQTSSGSSIASSDTDLTDNKWHVYSTGYLWIPGVHGTVGVRGFEASMHVTAGEIFSNFRGGFVGVFIPSYNRFSAPIDIMWMRLKDSKAIPFAPAYSVQALLNQAIITPKVSYLLVNNPKMKIYGTAGPRIWHVGTTLNLSPTILGRSLYNGTTWVDFVMGGQIQPASWLKSVGRHTRRCWRGWRNPGLPSSSLRELSIQAEVEPAGWLEIPHGSLRQQREPHERIDSGYRFGRNLQDQIKGRRTLAKLRT